MESHVTRGPRGGIPWGLIGMLAIVLVVEQFVVLRRDVDFSETVHLNWRYAKRMAVTAAPKAEILCLGSSQSKFGILPRVIEAETGRRSFNLSACGAGALCNYFILRRALHSGAKPAAVLVDYPLTPLSATDSDGLKGHLLEKQRLWPEILDVSDTFDLAVKSGSAEFFARTITARLLPSYKHRYEIRSNVFAALQGQRLTEHKRTFMLERNWWVNRGACVFPRKLDFEAKHQADVVHIPPQPDPRPEFVDRLGALYAKKFLKLAARNKIQVFWIIPPMVGSKQEHRNRTGEDERLTRFVREMQRRFPNLVIMDARRSEYQSEAFFDEVHLNGLGAQALSKQVASIVRQRLARPSDQWVWLNLPRYQTIIPIPDLMVEDILMSAKVLNNEAIRQASIRDSTKTSVK